MTDPTQSRPLTLYDLAEEAVALDAITAMDDGEWTPEAEALAEELTAKLVLKADSFGGYLAHLDAQEAAIAHEMERLADRRVAVKNRADRLKRFAVMAMTTMDRPKVAGNLFTLSVQNNPPSVEVDCTVEELATLYPSAIRVVPESRSIDKLALKAALKAGTTIPHVRLITTQSLRVR